jgi:hypothetical protein
VDACLGQKEPAGRRRHCLPAWGLFFPARGSGLSRGRTRAGKPRQRRWLAGSPSLLVQKPGTRSGLDPGKNCPVGLGREKGGWRRATKDRGGLGPPKTICCRAPPRHAQDVLAYCPYRDQALRDALSGTERVAWGHPVAPASTWDGRPDRSDRSFDSVRQGMWLGKTEGNAA